MEIKNCQHRSICPAKATHFEIVHGPATYNLCDYHFHNFNVCCRCGRIDKAYSEYPVGYAYEWHRQIAMCGACTRQLNSENHRLAKVREDWIKNRYGHIHGDVKFP